MLFGIPIWRLIVCVCLIILVIQRANIVAIFAKNKYRKRDYMASMKIFKIANKVGNLNLNNRMLLGYVCLRCGALLDARKYLQFASTLSKPDSSMRNQIKNLLALTLWKEGNLPEAIEELEELIDGGFKATVVYQNLGIFYNLSDDKEKALKFNLEAYDFNSDDHIICDNLADAYFKAGEIEKAAEVYEKFINTDPEPRFPEAYYGYGEVLIALGRKDEGIAMIEKSLTKPFSYLSIKQEAEVQAMLTEYKGA